MKNKIFYILIFLFFILATSDEVLASESSGLSRITPVFKTGDYKKVADRAAELSMTQLKQITDSLVKNRCDEYVLWYSAIESRPRTDFKQEDWQILARCYSNHGSYILYSENNNIAAAKLLHTALDIQNTHCDSTFALGGAYISLSHIYHNFSLPDKAIELLEKGCKRNLRSNSPRIANYILPHLVGMRWRNNTLDSLKPIFNIWSKARLEAYPLGRYCKTLSGTVENKIAGNIPEAVQLLRQAINLSNSESSNVEYIGIAAFLAAESLLEAGKTEEARSFLDRGYYNTYVPDDEFFLYKWYCDLFSRYQIQKGDVSGAKETRYKELLLRDSIYSLANYAILRDIEQQNIVDDLNFSEKTRELLLQKNRMQTNILLIVEIAAAIIITLLIWLLHRGKKVELFKSELYRRNKRDFKIGYADVLESPAASGDEPSEVADESVPDEESTGNNDNMVSDAEAEAIFAKVKNFVETDRAIFNIDFNIEQLAYMLGIRSRDISRVIKKITGKNFTGFLADYRIREAIRIITGVDKRERPTIEVIAEWVGYKSRSHFSCIFREVTGMTVSEFEKEHRKESLYKDITNKNTTE